jgi:hypothetical protein
MVSNTNKEFVEYARYLLDNEEKPLTKVHGIWERQQAYYTQLNKKGKVKEVLNEVLPYLIVKRKQAEVMLRFLKRRVAGAYYTAEDWADYLILRLLNDRRRPTLTLLVEELLAKFRREYSKRNMEWCNRNYPTIEYEKMIREAELIVRLEGYA